MYHSAKFLFLRGEEVAAKAVRVRSDANSVYAKNI